MSQTSTASLQLLSRVREDGVLELSLASAPAPAPGPDEVVIRIDAAPINPSDLGLLLGAADPASAREIGTPDAPVTEADIAPAAMRAMGGRLGQALPVGNEGAGLVVAAGSSPEAQALLGKLVAAIGGAMYSQYRTLPAAGCLVLPQGASAAQGASAFVNPLTALGMVETMRREGHTALVHTAAASNLGQMLQKVCLKDGIKLVNIVRSPAQVALLKAIGAQYVCDSSAPEFRADLTAALAATGATLAFDAIGGGKLAGQILAGMESAANQSAETYSRYGSTVHKQVYIYGGLDPSPTDLARSFGMAWGVGGWLLFPFLSTLTAEDRQRLRDRVATELLTTFASGYAGEISLRDVLRPEVIAAYGQRKTGAKYLISPSKA